MVDFYVTIYLHVSPPPCTHTLPHHTCHQRCLWLCCPCVPAEHHLLLLSGVTHRHWRKKVNQSSPSLSLHSEQTIHIILYMYKKNLALDNIYSVPTHHSEHCGRSVQNFRWYVFNGCPTKRKRQNVYDRYPGHESGEKRKRCLAWVMGVCPYLLTAPTKLHCHPYYLRACTVTEKHDSMM